METSARHLTVGACVVAIVLAIFGFTAWIHKGGGLQAHVSYVLRFPGGVSDLQPGAAVLFNGLHVGEVRDVRPDDASATGVSATLSVLESIPIRADTRASVEAQGMMGSTVVVLRGASATAPLLEATADRPKTLVASADAGNTLTAQALSTLRRLDGILADNGPALRETISNAKDFTGALSRNSGRIDSLFAALERLAGPEPKPNPPVYDLTVQPTERTKLAVSQRIVVSEPTAVLALQTQRLLLRTPDGQLVPTGTMQWSDTLPKLLQAKLIQSFNGAGLVATEGTLEGLPSEGVLLQIDLLRFGLTDDGTRQAEIRIGAKLVRGENRLIATRVFETEGRGAPLDDRAAVQHMNVAFADLTRQLQSWIVETISTPNR